MSSLDRRIRQHWTVPSGSTDQTAIVSFRIHRNGSISQLKLVKSASKEFNQSVLSAVRNAEPLYPLPDSAAPIVDIAYTFSAKASNFNGSDKANCDLFIAPYLYALQKKLRQSRIWRGQGTDVVVAKIRMLKNGDLESLQIAVPSKNTKFNRAVIQALGKASPVSLPKGLPAPMFVHIVFDRKLDDVYLQKVYWYKG